MHANDLDEQSYPSKTTLAQMMAHTREVVEQRKKEVPLAGVRALASLQHRPLDISSYLRQHQGVPLIAQLKRAAPDMNTPIEDYDLVMLAKRFEALKIAGITVATNEKYYRGGIADLTIVASNMKIPVIRQDFIYDEYQIVEARAAGADGVLLMASLLDAAQLRELISITQRNRMTAIVQVQDADEVHQAMAFEPRAIAISNRDMEDFSITLSRTPTLRPQIPSHTIVLSMGGLRTAEDVAYVYRANIDGIMVGQALLTAADTTQAIQDLFKLAPS